MTIDDAIWRSDYLSMKRIRNENKAQYKHRLNFRTQRYQNWEITKGSKALILVYQEMLYACGDICFMAIIAKRINYKKKEF